MEAAGLVVAIVAVIVALTQATGKERAENVVNNQQQTINNFDYSNSTLESANSSLERAVTTLEAQLQSASSPAATVTETATLTVTSEPPPVTESLPAGVSVRHAGELTLANDGSTADLDAPSTDPNWTTLGDPYEFEQPKNFALNLGSETSILPVKDTVPTYEYCQGKSGYSKGTYISSIRNNDWYCLKTSGNRFATVRMISKDDDETKMYVTTYDPPFS